MMDRKVKNRLQIAVHKIETIPDLLDLKNKIWANGRYDADLTEIQFVLAERQLFIENRDHYDVDNV